MAKLTTITITLPARAVSDVQAYVAKLNRPMRPLSKRQRVEHIDADYITDAVMAAKELRETRKHMLREYRRIEELYELDLPPADEKWVNAYEARLSRAIDRTEVTE